MWKAKLEIFTRQQRISLWLWVGNDASPTTKPTISSFIRYFSKIVTSNRTWVTMLNILQLSTLPPPKVKEVYCCSEQETFFQKEWLFHMRHIRAFHRSILTWRKGRKHSEILMRWSTKCKQESWLFEQDHLAGITRKPDYFCLTQLILAVPRLCHDSWFQEVKDTWWHQEMRWNEVLLPHAMRPLTHSGCHVWMSGYLEPRNLQIQGEKILFSPISIQFLRHSTSGYLPFP